MERVYTSLIIKRKKQLNEVPEEIREDVKIMLIKKGYPELTD